MDEKNLKLYFSIFMVTTCFMLKKNVKYAQKIIKITQTWNIFMKFVYNVTIKMLTGMKENKWDYKLVILAK